MTRQLIFGLDACEWDVVRALAAKGKLPTFARLLDVGCHGTLTTTARVLPDTVWSCIYGGQNPGHFDKYFYVQYDPRTRNLRHVHDDGFTTRPFWKILSDRGRSVGVIDAVKYPCTRPLNGFMMSNWGAHATKSPRESVPTGLWAEAERRFGRNPVGDVDRMNNSTASRKDMRERLLRGAAMRKDLLSWLVREQEWDTFFAGFSELHQVGHYFWHGYDASHPRHAEIVGEGVADTLERVYAAVDEAIGATIEAAGEDLWVMVVAGHGMGPLRHASWHLPEILDHLGYGPRPARPFPQGGEVEGKASFWRKLKKTLPGGLQYAIKERLPKRFQDELLFRWYAGRRDWDGWRAFAVPNNDTVGAIRIPVKGRDKDGLTEPGAPYRELRAKIQADLLSLTDPVSGRRVVRDVIALHDETSGPYRDQLPDLCVLWEQDFVWDRLHHEKIGTLRVRDQDSRTGSHTTQGFFIIDGVGAVARAEHRGHSIYDIAPTILSAAGAPLPADLDGRPIPYAGAHVRA
ncbi:MAG: hypothetical protein AB7I19_18495 [Planctomycetota bacterium]